MKKFKVLGLAGFLCTFGLTGCGGSSSGSGEGTSDRLTNRDQPQVESLSVPNYAPQTITEGGSESLVKSVYQHLSYIAWDAVLNSDEMTGTISPEQLVREFKETDTFDLSGYICPDSGSFKIKVLNGYPEIDAQEDLFFGPGDEFTMSFDNCAGQITLPGYTREGSKTIQVIEGYVGLSNDKVSSTALTKTVANRDGYVADGQLVGYIHGDREAAITGDSISFKGVSFKQNPDNQISLEYYLGDYSLAFAKIESASIYDRWEFGSEGKFLFGIEAFGGYFTTELQGLIFTDNQIESGLITLSDDQNSLRIELFQSHLTYELDLDGDGVYEINRMLNRGEF